MRPPAPGQGSMPTAATVYGPGLDPPRRWPWWLLALAMGVAVLWACDPLDDGDLGPVPEPVGQRIDEPIDLCLVIDDSSSTLDTDPEGNRYDAARFAARFLARQSHPDRPDRVCVVHFGGDAPRRLALPLTPVEQLARIEAAIQPVGQLGDTDFAAAHARATTLLGPDRPDRRQVMIEFTDGIPSGGPDVFARIAGSLDTLPRYHSHLIALDEADQFDDVRTEWDRMGLAGIQELSEIDGNRLEHAFARILVDELGMQWGG